MDLKFSSLFVLVAAGCTSSGASGNHTWTTIEPVESLTTQDGKTTGLWFDSAMNGVVAFDTGLIEHFSAPTTIDKVALDGHGQLPGPADDSYFGFIDDPTLGLVAIGSTSANLITSSDHGASFTYAKMYGQISAPAGVPLKFPLLAIGKDSSGTWHVADTAGGVWSSPAAPSASATFTCTWHPEGVVTVPATIPDGDCMSYVVNGYFATDPGHMFSITPDRSTMVYGAKDALCRSTDGGKTFVDVSSNITPSSFATNNTPWLTMFTSNTVGIAAFGSELAGPSTAYVLATSDAGNSWTVATLPAGAMNSVAFTGAFESPTGAMFIVGANMDENANLTPLLYKSGDGGKTWIDLSAKFAGMSGLPYHLVTGFALDDQNVWVGGENGFVAYSATGGQ